MIAIRITFILLATSLCACSPQSKLADADAHGYQAGAVTGHELLYSARSHAVLASSQTIGMEKLIQESSLSEAEKETVRTQVDELLTTILDSSALASKYNDPAYSESDRRQVFRAVENRVETARSELRDIRDSLRRRTAQHPG